MPDPHSESDLQRGLVRQMKNFILELGKDFLLIGEEYKLQVGSNDFFIDLLFYHRGLQCLVAFELKADKFKPDHSTCLSTINDIKKMAWTGVFEAYKSDGYSPHS